MGPFAKKLKAAQLFAGGSSGASSVQLRKSWTIPRNRCAPVPTSWTEGEILNLFGGFTNIQQRASLEIASQAPVTSDKTIA